MNDVADKAFLTQQSYTMLGKESKTERLKKIDDAVASRGWRSVRNGSNRDITTYEKIDDPNVKHITHRGTDTTGKKTWKDVKADVAGIFLGQASKDKEFNKRTNRTKKILNDNPDNNFSMSGHSMGSSTAAYAMAHSKNVRDRIDRLDTFNMGMTPAFKSEIKVGQVLKRQLKDKVHHHRVKGDVVSHNLTSSTPFGMLHEVAMKPQSRVEKNKKNLNDPEHIAEKQGRIHSLENWI